MDERTYSQEDLQTFAKGLIPLANSRFGENFDYGDLWGSTMGLAFNIADTLNYLGETIPDEWEYRRGSAVSLEDLEDFPEMLEQDPDYLRYIGNRAMEFRDTLERFGLSY